MQERLRVSWRGIVGRLDLAGPSLRLGSGKDTDLRIAVPGVSRTHALLRSSEQGWTIEDLGSKNGLRVAGVPTRVADLRPGRPVQIGEALIELELVASSDLSLDLALDSGGESRASAFVPTRAASAAEELGTAAAALRLVCAIDATEGDVDEYLPRVRETLEAHCLLRLQVDDRGDALVACAGPLPAEEAVATLVTAAGTAAEGVSARALGAGVWALMARRRGEVLVASLTRPPEPWQEDFLGFVGAKLWKTSPDTRPARPRVMGGLAIPEGMVVGPSPAMVALLERMRATLPSDRDVLLTGETGTGKELMARMIHESGKTAGHPFVAINCAAIPAELLEAELFGVGARVATGVDARLGHFQRAEGGTLFLDEIGELPEKLQAKLLRVLQEREILPIGAATARKIRVRIVAATNRDLPALVRAGSFRADLYFRLRAMQFHVPALRERREDLPHLLLSFARRAAARYERRLRGVSRRAIRLVAAYDWPGNVRELQDEVENAVLLCGDGEALESSHFGAFAAAEVPADGAGSAAAPAEVPGGTTLRDRRGHRDREELLRALAACNGNKTQAARALGVSRYGLRLMMSRLGIPQESGK